MAGGAGPPGDGGKLSLEEIAEIFDALGDTTRFRMMRLCRFYPASVQEMAEDIGTSYDAIRFHLRRLIQGNLIDRAGDAVEVYYQTSERGSRFLDILVDALGLSTISPGRQRGIQTSARRARSFRSTVDPVIKTLWRKGEGLKEIAEELNRQGFQTRRGARWHKVQVARYLNAMGIPTGPARSHERELSRVWATLGSTILWLTRDGDRNAGRIARELNRLGIKGRQGGKIDRKTIAVLIERFLTDRK